MRRESDSGLGAALLAAAAVALSIGLQLSNGLLSDDALAGVGTALMATAAALVVPRWWRAGQSCDSLPVLFLVGGLVWSFSQLTSSPPAWYLRFPPGWTMAEFLPTLVMATFLAGAVLAGRPWLRNVSFLLLLAAHFRLGNWLLHASPDPDIDVWVFHRDSMAAFMNGHDPYSLTFSNIYGQPNYYGDGLVADGRLQVGFPYPPLSLFLALLGKWTGGDYRYATLAAMDLAALFMAFSRPGRLSKLAAAAFLFMPRTFFVLEQGWTEPFVVLGVAATVFCACRRPRWVPYVLGLLLAVKQYAAVALALAQFLWARPFSWRSHLVRLGKSAGLAAVLTVPFVLWDVRGFVNSVLLFQVRQPLRQDALSFLAEYAHTHSGQVLPSAIGFGLGLVALAAGVWLARWTPSGFAAAMAFAFLVFFAFGKQAFCNYYYFVQGTLCCAVAAAWNDGWGRNRRDSREGSAGWS